MRWIALLALAVLPSLAAETAKPPCNAGNRGRLWPEQANTDPAVAGRAGRCGELQMCAPGVYKYGWQTLTVHISRLGKDAAAPIPGCEARPAEGPTVQARSEPETGEQVSRP